MNSIKHLEYQQCRACYDSPNNLELLTSVAEYSSCQTDEKTYSQLLLEVCDVNIMEDKPLGHWPSFICFKCSHKLKLAYEFIHQTRKINNLLKSIADVLQIKNKSNFIENPELDIPLEIKIENDMDTLPNERAFQYSPSESEAIKAESIAVTSDIPEFSYNSCKRYKIDKIVHETTKEVIIPSAIEFINNDSIIHADVYNLPKNNVNNNNNVNNVESSKSDLVCTECNKLFANTKSLNRHKRVVHISKVTKISCPNCTLKFDEHGQLKRHTQIVHKNDKSQVANIPKKTKIISTVSASTRNKASKKKNEQKVEAFPCSICKKVYDSGRKLTRHTRYVHVPEKDKLTCHCCERKFARRDNYKTHMKFKHGIDDVVLPKKVIAQRSDEKKFFCDKCDRSYSRRYRLHLHERKAHG